MDRRDRGRDGLRDRLPFPRPSRTDEPRSRPVLSVQNTDPIGPVIPQPEPDRQPPPGELQNPVAPLDALRPELLRGDVAGTVGRTVELVGGYQQAVSVLKATGYDRNPELITVQVIAQTPDGKAPPYHVRSRLQWGVGGGSHSARVSCGLGAVFTLAATAIDVAVELLPLVPGETEPTDPVLVTAVLSSGARPGPSPVCREAVYIASGGRGAVEAAAWSSSVSLWSPVSLAGLPLEFHTATGVVLATTTVASDQEAAQGYMLPPGAASVFIPNNPGPDAPFYFGFRLVL